MRLKGGAMNLSIHAHAEKMERKYRRQLRFQQLIAWLIQLGLILGVVEIARLRYVHNISFAFASVGIIVASVISLFIWLCYIPSAQKDAESFSGINRLAHQAAPKEVIIEPPEDLENMPFRTLHIIISVAVFFTPVFEWASYLGCLLLGTSNPLVSSDE